MARWLLLALGVLVGGAAGGLRPDSGYCIGTECFTVFRDPSSFSTAQRECGGGGGGGRVMTVRSSVSHDILSVLLGNSTGSFWIGLHRPTGCPEPAAALRGFRWVTGDTESDFSNWLPGTDSSCSSGRCVSVSTDNDLKWVPDQCGMRAAGFLCEHSFSDMCTTLAAEPGQSVTYRTPLGFGGEDLPVLPPGTSADRVPDRNRFLCFSRRWLEAPWNCEILEGGCEFRCAVDPTGTPACYCPPGRALNTHNRRTCDEHGADDPCAALRCQHACYRQGESYACMCEQGFQLAADGRSCTDFNDCSDRRQCPGDNFVCVNTPGGFQCVCAAGYKMSGALCVDEDECVSAPCEHMCTNTEGSYRCSCYDGYRQNAHEPNTCARYCGREECAAECDPNDRFQCFCPEGYISEERGTGVVCMDIDECAFSYCDQKCSNTFGGYVCACAPGYTLVNEFRCVKTDDEDSEGGPEGGQEGPEGGQEGSGMTAAPDGPSDLPLPGPGPTRRPSGVPLPGPGPTRRPSGVPLPGPGPTRRPSGVPLPGLVAIIVGTAASTLLLVLLGNYCWTRRVQNHRDPDPGDLKDDLDLHQVERRGS